MRIKLFFCFFVFFFAFLLFFFFFFFFFFLVCFVLFCFCVFLFVCLFVFLWGGCFVFSFMRCCFFLCVCVFFFFFCFFFFFFCLFVCLLLLLLFWLLLLFFLFCFFFCSIFADYGYVLFSRKLIKCTKWPPSKVQTVNNRGTLSGLHDPYLYMWWPSLICTYEPLHEKTYLPTCVKLWQKHCRSTFSALSAKQKSTFWKMLNTELTEAFKTEVLHVTWLKIGYFR